MKNGAQYQVKVTVIGAPQVGKSALTVRYLTRRYIGEYKSHTDLSYRQVFCLDGSSIEVEIVDVSNQPEDTTVPTNRAKNSDACVVVYSIADRASFRSAQEALIGLMQPGNSAAQQRSFEVVKNHRSISQQDNVEDPTAPVRSRIPVVLLANKKDLGHLRQVETSEGEELARRFSCVCFREVSAAETDESDHYSSSSSPPRPLDTPVEELNLTGIFTQLIREARLHKIRQQDANNNAESPPGVQGNNNNNNNSRQRKRSVFTINRMLGSLMGRNSSMPPDLPSARAKGGASNLGSSMPNVAGSFRSVFKKRSV